MTLRHMVYKARTTKIKAFLLCATIVCAALYLRTVAQPVISLPATIMVDSDISEWKGLLTGARPKGANIHVVAPLRPSTTGGSGAFLALASDQRHYWIKPLNSPQGNRVAITEQIVASAGALIGAPVCPVEVIYISNEVANSGWEFRKGRKLVEGCAHGSLALGDEVDEHKKLIYRECDDNSKRHAGYYALYDWCWGGDAQGLLVITDDRKFYSHDHGHFLPPNSSKWDVQNLLSNIDKTHQYTEDVAGLDHVEILELADRLDSVTRQQILSTVSRIPENWPVTDAELETVGYFLEERAPNVAERLRNLV